MKKFSALLCSTVVFVPTAAFAQSTGTVEQEKKEIIVTGQKRNGVDGIVAPQGVKTRGVLTQEFISKQRPGQSVDETINMLPGVAFQNNDPYGSSGGTLNIRGFDASRISQTFDGLPLNDTGNYALYSNQQLDPELIQQVNVNLGTTDVDSPTAAATGSTVNYRSVDPTIRPGARVVGSMGSWDFRRIFGMINTGSFTPWGTRAWIAGSFESNENPYQRTSKTHKEQYNAKIYQPLGSNGDFISIAGHYNANRNGNFASVPLRTDPYVYTVTGTSPHQVLVATPRVVGSGSTNRFPLSTDEANYTLLPCTTDAPQPGVADVPNSCGTAYDASFNPSNTGNIRINSKFTLADNLVLTVDPSFQYTRANGGSSAVRGNEGFYTRLRSGPIYGYIGGQPYFGGVDLNGDGDVLDGVEVYAPSETETHRYGLIANLRYDFTPDQSVRLSYAHDYGRHVQTGEVAYLQNNGYTTQYFPINDPILDASGLPIEKRNRKSYAILDKLAVDYTGRFFDRLTVDLGLGSPWFKRDLNNYCVTESNGSYVDCFNDPTSQAAFLAANPTYTPPTHRVVKYHKLLPTAGVNYLLTNRIGLYADYNKGLQVPGTDNLYQSLAFPDATPQPETTDNFDAGVRYTSARVQAQLAAWYTIFTNRLASSYDPINDITVYRNLGTVHKYGLDGQIAYQPAPPVTLYAFGSVLKSKILDNVQSGTTPEIGANGRPVLDANGDPVLLPVYYMTAGKRESGAPTYLAGARIEYNAGIVVFGAQAKRTGPRFVNDQNLPVVQTYTLNGVVTPYTVYGAKAPAYTVIDLDARINISPIFGIHSADPARSTYLQLNVTNLFNKLYVAGFGGNTSTSSVPFAYIGAPRTLSASLNVGF